ncbi:hypothetical protein KY290_027775 [Solanum tuberosum]|uniref:GI12756 n=1 Tax=Solanum tuberosum TaxID=4113 RepID=A0ABQ7UH80_SOLTU|nr:hypothetical protein KY284_029047 [Solanum tuberosum]KAH0748543.1 hypothetical protein KY290_027775 [Solanum tuberosum]
MATQRNNPNTSKSMANQRNNPNTSKSMADQRSNSNSNPNPNPNPNNSKSINKKRQPFADISNFNLIPTSTLRKLCSFSSPSTLKSQNVIPKPPISDSNSSKPNYKEANSETSVASSDFNSLQNPNPLLPGKSSAIPSGRGNEAVLYNRRHTTKKSNLEATALPFTSSHENKKDKRKEIDVPCLSLPPPTVMKDKGKAIAEPFSSLSPETRQDKGKRAVVLSTPVSGDKAVVNNRRQTAKRSNLEASALPFTSSHENKEDKRKEIDEPFLSLPPPTVMKNKGKAIAEPFSCLSPETRQDKGKRAVVLSTPVSGNKKTKGIHEPFMSSSPQKAKSKAQAISHEHFPSDEKAAEETVGVSSGSCSSLKRTRGKGIVDASVFSCPTLPKKRTNRSEFSGVGDIKPSGSWTDPTGKRKKRRCTQQKPAIEESLPQDFVNYWREHFKEIDEFELPEEEASYSDLE